MSGRATSRVKDRTDVAKLIADLDPALLSAGNYRGPRHAKVSAGYGKYIGRVGALAVTLGVGIAVASTPTVAKADDGDAGASENSPGSTGGESAGPSTSVSTRNEETQDDGKAHGGGASSGTGTDTTGTDVPTMNVGSSGGAIDSTYGTVGSPIDKHDDEHEDEHDEDAEQEATEQESGAEESTDATPAQPESPADTAVPAADEQPGPDQGAENAAENVDPVPSDESPSAGEPPAPGGAGRAADTGDEQETGEGEHVFLTAALDEDSEPAGLNSAAKFAKVQLVPSTEKPVDLVAAVMSIPGAIVDAATFAVTAILSPLLVNGPAAPPQMPLLWTVLAWVRREITHTFFNRRPIAYPQQNIQLVPGLVTGDLDAHDPNGDPLTYTVVNGPRLGTVVVNPDGTYVYTRDAAHLLSDEQDSFTVRISDSAATHLPGIFGLIQGVFETTARFFGLAQRDNLLVDVPVTMQVVPSLVAPVVVALPVADPYTLGQDPSEVGKAVISVADPDSSVLTGATVAIGLGATSGDTLHFVNTDKIKGVWDADSYTLTLTGYASAAEYQAALQSITFTASSVSTVVRTINFVATDGTFTGVPAVTTVSVLPPLVGPVIVALPMAPSYTLGRDPAAVGDAVLSLIDLDSSTLSGATVRLGAGATEGDTLLFTDTDNIKGTWDASSYTLTLTGNATVEEYEAALQSVTFTATQLGLVGRTVTFTATDGSILSIPAATVLAVLPAVNIPPTVVVSPAGGLTTVGGDPLQVGSAVLAVGDLDSDTLGGATVQIVLGGTSGDTLHFVDTDKITGSWDASSYTLTLSGDATADEYKAALQSITFTATDAGILGRTVSFIVNDGEEQSLPGLTAVVVVPDLGSLNAPPVVVVSPAVLDVATAGGDPAAVGSAVLVVADIDSDTLTGATVKIVLGGTSGDTLHFVDTDTITGSWDPSSYTLTLTGDASVAEYEAALKSITFSATNAGLLSRTLSFSVTDDQEAQSPAAITALVVTPDLSAINVAPVVVVSPGLLELATAGGDPVNLGAAVLSVTDLNSEELAGATVKIILGGTSGDTLHFVDTDKITGSWDASSYTLTLTGDASVAEYEAALKSITFSAESTGLLLSRSISFTVTDGELTSLHGLTGVVVAPDLAAVNLPPVVLVSPAVLDIATAGGDPVQVGSAVLSVADLNSGNLAGATVRIVLGGTNGDKLHFVDTDTITGSWDASSYTLTLSGNASVAEYQAALQSITFTADSAGILSRTVSFEVSDGEYTSLPGVTGVVVAPDLGAINVPPVVVVSPVVAGVATVGGDPLDVGSAVLTVRDLNNSTITGATVSILVGTEGDELHFTDIGDIKGSWDASSYTLTLSGDGTAAEYEAALQSITFTAGGPGLLLRTITFTVTDGDESLPGVTTVAVAPDLSSVNVPPVLVVSPAVLDVATAGGSPVEVGSAVLAVADLDSANLAGATVRITTGATNGDKLHFVDTDTITGSWDASSYTLTLSGNASVADYEAALQSVTFSAQDAGLLGRTISFTVSDGQYQSISGLTALVVAPDLGGLNVPPVVVVSPVVAGVATVGGDPLDVGSAVLTVRDLNNSTITGATVSILVGTEGDELHFTDIGDIKGSWDASSYTLTLSGDGTAAEYEAALQSITFTAG
ncbi:Ig-like domain-containing protein, partial [Mycolicibacterium phlei]